jgi:hypothetical protein
MAGEFIEFFNELLFGSGAWMGAILISAIILLVTYRVKYSGVVFMPICIFLGMQYLNTVPANSNLMWIAILMFIMAIYSLAMLIRDVRT